MFVPLSQEAYRHYRGVTKRAELFDIDHTGTAQIYLTAIYIISHGVVYAAKLYPESYMVQVLVGVARGAGSGVMKIVEQLVRGTWIPSQHEMLRPSFTTKACVIAALVFTLERNSMYVTAPHDLVYLCVVGFFSYFKLSALLLGVVDPSAPIENLFCALFMGGICDALHK
ncbi:unnamed protein product [Cylicostephanus goldi]|uniref:Uncharacterized protein n=1 Tax=Cylicostephanus goldi TaxID=71465 RepID=A0A3P6SN95_CYLGO|nr:unnamed protein product [Cylicostephanus goldi]